MKYARVIISMVLCNAIVIIEYDGSRSEIPSAPLDVKYDNSIIEQSTNSHSHSSKV